MPRQMDDLTGRRFARLVVIEYGGREGRHHQLWRCQCDCGAVIVRRANTLKTGLIKSCGCLKREVTGNRARTHGLSQSREFFSYNHAKQRCCNPNDSHYKSYGGRGIKMCRRWLGVGGFERFYADMGPLPSGGSLERKNVNGNYSPSNCCWIPRPTQARNKRCTIRMTIDGVTRTLYEWAAISGIAASTIKGRIQRGWNHADSVFLPLQRSGPKKRHHVG